MNSPEIMEPSACTWCGIAQRGHGRQYADAAGWHEWEQPSQEQMLARMKARRLQLAVTRTGALPTPAGPEPISEGRLAEIRSLDLLSMMSDRVAPVVSRALADLIAEVERLRAQRDRRRDRLVALQNDALNMRGVLSPNGEARKVPMPLGDTLAPAMEWLVNRVAELEAERHATNEVLSDAAEALREQRDQMAGLEALGRKVAAVEEGFEALKAQGQVLRGSRGVPSLEGEFHSFLHRAHKTPHDLPPVGGA